MTDVADDKRSVIVKALARRRQLAHSEFTHFGAKVAQSLEALADHSDELRDWDEALAALEESVAVTRDLAAAEAKTFLAPLSARLIRLSTALYQAGDFARAIATAREAVDHYRQVFAERPDAVRHSLILALKHLSCGLAVTGDSVAALAVMREAVAEHRSAVNASLRRSDACGLAWSIGLLGMRLRLAGNIEGARAATAEAIAILDDGLEAAGDGVAEAVRAYLCREYDSLVGQDT
jgi:tetratricopeptide (TPR) repeat protein